MIRSLICGTAMLLMAASPAITIYHRHVQAMQRRLQVDEKIIANYKARPKVKNPIMVIDGVPVIKLERKAIDNQPNDLKSH